MLRLAVAKGEILMKVLTVIVPSYNSEDYLSKCIDSLLESGDNIEILIINDGSKDQTGEIAETYMKNYPKKIKVIHQENAGHGGAVNTGIANASGKYIKVVDSDDWVNPTALKKIVAQLRYFILKGKKIDMFINNFVYDKVGSKNKMVMDYRDILPVDEVFTWKDVSRFKPGKYILMHSVIYNLEVLKACELKLPKNTFYVDNLFLFLPIPYVNSMYYMDVCMYHYFIGREDQSVNENNMINRIDQQLLVNKHMIDHINLKGVKEKPKRKYMLYYLSIVTTVSSVLLYKKGTEEAIKMKHDLWRYIKKLDYKLYLKIRVSLLGSIINIPGKLGRKISLFVYKKVKKRYGFN